MSSGGIDQQWHEAVTCALLGTTKRTVPDFPVTDVTEREGSAEARLLDQLALAAMWRRAGVVTERAAEVSLSPSDEMPVAPTRAVHVLELALDQPPGGAQMKDKYVQSWAARCEEFGYRVPPSLLPKVLDFALSRYEVAGQLMRVVGHRGQWLAATCPRWSVLATIDAHQPTCVDVDDDTNVSEVPSDIAQRPITAQVEALSAVRRNDPGLARDTIALLCQSASAKDRRQLVEVLHTNISSDDEQFVQSLLRDRSKLVHSEAVSLIERIEGTARSARMAQRLRELIQVERSLLKKQFTVDLPGEADDVGVADGLGRRRSGESVRGSDLRLIVAGAPLSTWGEVTGARPAAIVRQMVEQKNDDVLTGLRRAVEAQHNSEWAREFIQHEDLPQDMLRLLQRDETEKYILTMLATHDISNYCYLLTYVPSPWSEDFSRKLIDTLRRRDLTDNNARHVTDVLVSVDIHPAVADALKQWAQELDVGYARRNIANLHSSLTFDQTISEAFS